MTAPAARLTIAVLTYRRPADIAAALPLLVAQASEVAARTDIGITVDVLVIDNDPQASARDTVIAGADSGIRYVHEPEPGIAHARNRALAETAESRWLVFIDDDERPHPGWLRALLDTQGETGAAVVAGAVVSEFAVAPDEWLAAGEFFRRRRLPTGTPIDVAATNNLLLDLDVIRRHQLTFDVDFGLSGGEDTLFTCTLAARGVPMVWCNEAVVTDWVPEDRVTRRWVLARAYSSGNSVGRVAIRLAVGPRARTVAVVKTLALGMVRGAGGSARAALGYLRRSPADQAKGLRTAARGWGMLNGVLGRTYQEYGRG